MNPGPKPPLGTKMTQAHSRPAIGRLLPRRQQSLATASPSIVRAVHSGGVMPWQNC